MANAAKQESNKMDIFFHLGFGHKANVKCGEGGGMVGERLEVTVATLKPTPALRQTKCA